MNHETFLAQFRGQFLARARQAPRYEWPLVRARPLTHAEQEQAGPDALAEFAAGYLTPASPRSSPEPWQVSGVLYRDSKGPPIVGDLRVEHFPIRRKAARMEVTGTVLRGLPLAAIRDAALAAQPAIRVGREAMATAGGFGITPDDVEQARRVEKEAGRPKPGRPGYPDEHYRQIALRYLELLREGRRHVLVALADEEGRPRETVRDWVRKATERGYLAPGKPGRAESRPGANLYPKGGRPWLGNRPAK